MAENACRIVTLNNQYVVNTLNNMVCYKLTLTVNILVNLRGNTNGNKVRFNGENSMAT